MKKKVLILQSKGRQVGGVWFVNRTLAEGLADRGYEVEVLCVRNNPTDMIPKHKDNIKVFTINEKDLWEITKRRDILNSLKSLNVFKFLKLLFKRRKELKILKNDYKKIKDYIFKYNPNFIINSHYELLDAIPKEYLGVTINEIHTSYNRVKVECLDAIKKLNKYNNKLGKMVWLTNATCKDAIDDGYKNSICIYNPIRFNVESSADVVNNKKLVTMCRLSSNEKRLDLMVEIVNEIFKDKDLKDWSLELYGPGEPDSKTLEIINNNDQIKIMGSTDKPEEALLKSSIYLSTSPYEGLSLSILEAMECGVPTVAYHFGESTEEEIIENETGLIIPFGNKEEYINKLSNLMKDNDKLSKMSLNSKNKAEDFSIEKILNEWGNLLESLEKGD